MLWRNPAKTRTRKHRPYNRTEGDLSIEWFVLIHGTLFLSFRDGSIAQIPMHTTVSENREESGDEDDDGRRAREGYQGNPTTTPTTRRDNGMLLFWISAGAHVNTKNRSIKNGAGSVLCVMTVGSERTKFYSHSFFFEFCMWMWSHGWTLFWESEKISILSRQIMKQGDYSYGVIMWQIE